MNIRTGDNMILHIKNMVCDRCIRVVREELAALGITVHGIALGEVAIDPVDDDTLQRIREVLLRNGFELLDDRRARIVEKIKTAVVELVYGDAERLAAVTLSDYIAGEVGMDYHYLSSLFSSHEGMTLEKFIIQQKIERVKELLTYGELTLSEIAYALGYSSVAHLSSQFKKVVGLSATDYKNLHINDRRPIDHVR